MGHLQARHEKERRDRGGSHEIRGEEDQRNRTGVMRKHFKSWNTVCVAWAKGKLWLLEARL